MDLESLRNMEKGYKMQMDSAKSAVRIPQLPFSLWFAPSVNFVRFGCGHVWPDLRYALQDEKTKLQAKLAEIEARKKALKRGQ
jgi:hypothetical protein